MLVLHVQCSLWRVCGYAAEAKPRLVAGLPLHAATLPLAVQCCLQVALREARASSSNNSSTTSFGSSTSANNSSSDETRGEGSSIADGNAAKEPLSSEAQFCSTVAGVALKLQHNILQFLAVLLPLTDDGLTGPTSGRLTEAGRLLLYKASSTA
jgi:hypothetical protein